MGAVAELAIDAERIAGLGHNRPPEPTSWEAIKVHMEDLLVEAYAWADGTTVENQAQADEASRLVGDLNKAAKAAEDLRVEEKKPFDEALAEIQGRFNPYIADRKNKTPGKVWKAVDALKACVKPYLDKLEDERKAEAEKARLAAEEAVRAAAEAARAAAPSDLGAQDSAEDLIAAAHRAQADAKRIEAARPQARGGERAMGLRRTFTAIMTDRKAALIHYVTTRPDDLAGFLQTLADRDVREGKRTIPGFTVEEGTAL